ncbi:MAG: hypothetical protein UMU76_09625 [Prosthecochloris sp.]|nr:hypothetical protein [Prosthecochloris sp.]
MLLVNRFIRLIEDHAESLSLKWVDEVRSNPLTEGYTKYSRQELHDIVFSRFRKLGEWVEQHEGPEHDIARNFREIGKERCGAGIRSSEMVYSFMIERDMLLRYVQDEGVITEGIDLNRALQFTERLNFFYDKAIYFALVGYEQVACNVPGDKEESEFEKTVDGFKHWLVKE